MTARAWPRDGSLLREAQAAILTAFDNANTITATQLRVATAGFSKKTANRGRAELTRAGVLIRSRHGMEGEVTYTIDQGQLASLTAQYRSRRFSKIDQQRQRMTNNAAAASAIEECDAADDVNDAINNESTRTVSGDWDWLVPIIICICGLGVIGFMRSRFGAFPIGKPESFPGAFDFAPERDA